MRWGGRTYCDNDVPDGAFEVAISVEAWGGGSRVRGWNVWLTLPHVRVRCMYVCVCVLMGHF